MTTRRQLIRTSAMLGVSMGALTLTGASPFIVSSVFASVQTPQTPLLGANIPQFLEPLPTFAKKRVSSTSLTVCMQEFQQKILPASLYSGLKPPFHEGTFLWGYKVDNQPPSYPGYTIEARQGYPTTVTYINELPLPASSKLVKQLTIDQTIH